jgi:3-methylfumaryl-CoA hydratase
MSVSTESPEIDLAHLRTWIGREEVAVDVVSDDLARKFHATLDMPGEAPSVGEAAPGLIHFCLAPQIAPTAQLGPDGHPRRGGFLPPVPLPRRMWAGGRLTFSRPIRVGDCICRTSRIGDVAAKTGRSGALVFVKVEHTLDVQGEAAVEEVHDIVYRGLAATSAATPAPAEVSPNRRRIDVSPTLLFRYSALTFNGHRIHYDLKYAKSEEGYPGLVVHGPLQATLLLHHAAALRGKLPRSFDYRNESTLFDDAPFWLDATETASGLTLWTSREGGPVGMRAQAVWE